MKMFSNLSCSGSTETRRRLVGGHRRSSQQFPALDQAADAAAEGEGEIGFRCTQSGPPRVHAVLHERLVHGLRSRVQILRRGERFPIRQRK